MLQILAIWLGFEFITYVVVAQRQGYNWPVRYFRALMNRQ